MKFKNKIKILVQPTYLEDHSDPSENSYLWAYTVKIKNNGDDTIKLISRHWKIFDSNGSFREVKGKGVVGEQPIIHPGDEFEYTSGTPLKTNSGLMHGSYQMEDFNGESFEVLIPPFSLDVPNDNKRLN
jgi:ApaG protein|tara:strand:+ start:2202 stop:2588 length:387 start_codon:yes stop_codon:yes gene_type:complete